MRYKVKAMYHEEVILDVYEEKEYKVGDTYMIGNYMFEVIEIL